MVEANQASNGGILKNAHEGGARHVQFDEEEIAAYDAQRGQCMPINDPKTPFHEENSDEDMEPGADGQAAEDEEIDPELAQHLAEARAN